MPFVLEGPKWGSNTLGTPATVTWSFADQDVDAQLAQTYGGYPDFTATIAGGFRDLVRSAFSQWDAISDIDFVEVADSTQSNIRLGELAIDGRAAPGNSSVLGTAQYWYSGSTFRVAAIKFDVDAFDSSQIFFNTALHEIGHAIGLDHTSAPSDIMYPSQNAQNAGGLSIGDISGVRALYTGGSTFEGTSASDLLTGGTGPDLIVGYEGSDTINAGDGADLVMAGDGDDLIYGNVGNDVIYGNVGLDRMIGGQGADLIFGGRGADLVYGNLGNDVVYGNLDNDTVFGGQGDDRIYAGQGDDLLSGNVGNDTLIGGIGADRYVFGTSNGADLILGFTQSDGDRLDFGGQTYTSGSDGQGGTLFTLSGGGTVDLVGVSALSINPAYFA